uniref:Protein with SprT-like domain at the N terminus n=1 Tax=Saccoglossus kowalevskii TaxID=10224 RepID=A0ABM0MW20_SACKO|nr:PREDICTED: sprT-like domain-containing protein Spartan-like [Saccoglossus kowalevskii]
MSSSDHDIAKALQEEYDQEAFADDSDYISSDNVDSSKRYLDFVDKPLSIVDDQWELLDPNPDIRMLFLAFNDKYFWGKLAGVEVRWSPRMTLCAGLCCYEGRGGLCSVRLSLPLLKLRPRKDLVETLLHEMIHALLFVTDNNKDHDGHGPEFLKHMHRLNKETGTNISVYHTFHDEVNNYRQHWWKCNGVCQKKPPYFGVVKRAMNRAPSARDPWWGEHQRSCGGIYIKIKEPDGYGQKKSKNKSIITAAKKDKKKDGIDIRNLFVAKKQDENNAEEEANDVCPPPVFSGLGNKLGGSTTGISRLLGNSHGYSHKEKASTSFDNGQVVCINSSDESTSCNYSKPSLCNDGSGDIDASRAVKKPKLECDVSEICKSKDSSLTANQKLVGEQSCDKSGSMVDCPVCADQVLKTNINDHLDLCLFNQT